jgi:hypothetical protein
MARENIAHDAQKKQSDHIAIEDEDDFWQPPLEPWKLGTGSRHNWRHEMRLTNVQIHPTLSFGM